MEEFLRVGVITSVHGVHGEVKVFPTTDDADRFRVLKNAFLDTKQGKKQVEIGGVKFFKNMVILKIKGLDDRNEAEKLKGIDILVDRENAVPLEEGEFYICDIIGADVITDEDVRLGELTDVLETGANDVYVVTPENGKDILLPAIDECILDVDPENKVVRVHVMKGLL